MSRTSRPPVPRTLKSFPRFSELAKELRIAIWAEALKLPRTVTITKYGPVKQIDHTNPSRVKKQSLRAVWQLPPLLQVNRESREEALWKYVALFTFFENQKPVYFNLESDWLCFDTLGTMRKLFQMDFTGVLPENRACACPSFPFYPSSSSKTGRELKLVMQNVRKLMFEDENGDGGPDTFNFLWKWKKLEKVLFTIPTYEAIGETMVDKFDREFGCFLRGPRLGAYRRRALQMMRKVGYIDDVNLRELKYRMVMKTPSTILDD